MSIQASSSLYGLDESLSRADQELFSIYLQYPQAVLDDRRNLDAEQDQTREPSTITSKHRPSQGSDASTLVEDQSQPSSEPTSQRQPYFNLETPSSEAEWGELTTLLKTSTLPRECLCYYTLLGETIMNLGTELFSTVRPGKPSDLVQFGMLLLKNVAYSCKQANLQVEAIASLKQLGVFNVKPGPTQVWSTYSQRARMITK